jgi:cobalt/nickel transport system ATP-binding protein
MDDLLIQLRDIRFGYTPGRPVLNGLCLDVGRRDRIALLGPNGSGKTTLFHLIMGLLSPWSGVITAFGKQRRGNDDFREVRRRAGLLFQDADDQLFWPTVLEDVAFGPLNLGRSPEAALETAKAAITTVGLSAFENRLTHRLSGGEKRMAALAAVVAMEPEILLLDEPSSGLDPKTKNRLAEILTDLKKPFVLITHDADFADRTAGAVYLMEAGKILTEPGRRLHRHLHAHPLGEFPHSHRHGDDI